MKRNVLILVGLIGLSSVAYAAIKCSFCNGTGFKPNSPFTCEFCNGKGFR
ncbi:hypothetical protein OPIT5_01205 [Opitutaceae bacterium TAV5]|nr:hypothetical protein OPIT5_01205 [Opitutaceae bacterium TAV5]